MLRKIFAIIIAFVGAIGGIALVSMGVPLEFPKLGYFILGGCIIVAAIIYFFPDEGPSRGLF